ncbi:hypothetical protein [Bradyrhizobium elkanii]|uniref:hypothetical protein n=1 Tax=Bradyrhizobium elkanii TaxID=29448 RepID=UPI0027154B55|nr:hypothetical protein [Bradyrhizobium elkanii]WLA50722.1 hypothetical protein QIH80_11405 [Bradyrhizobium elkanii]WLB79040.1 hypothetical protein QIH83_32610 [Bradyrhizobium elkanii]
MISACELPTDANDTRIGPAAQIEAAPNVSPDDRLPTVAEVKAFGARQAVAAWDRLPPEQQRKIGALAVELAIVGGSTKFDLGWTLKHLDAAYDRTDALLQHFYEQTEPLWADFYGWRAQ